MSGDIYRGSTRIGRVVRSRGEFLAFAVDDSEGALRPLGVYCSLTKARRAVIEAEARHAA